MGMIARLAAVLSVLGALLLAGCGGQSTTSASHSATRTVDVGASLPAAPARHAIAKRLAGKALGRHASKAPNALEDNEGPDKPSTAHPLPPHTYRVVLTGKSRRVGGVDGSEVGVVRLLPKTRQVCWQFARLPKVTVHTAAFGGVRMVLRPESASIRVGARGANGPVVAPLYARFAPRGCTVVAPVVLNSILAAPRLYYVSLGSATSPAGALRAQL